MPDVGTQDFNASSQEVEDVSRPEFEASLGYIAKDLVSKEKNSKTSYWRVYTIPPPSEKITGFFLW